MYIPKRYAAEDRSTVEQLVLENPFATLISIDANIPLVSHLPLLWEKETEGHGNLIGHIARANPHCRFWESNPEIYVIFHGPHSYITPTWYAENNVPTWNYMVVHMRGRLRILEKYEELETVLKKSATAFEEKSSRAWNYLLPEDLSDPKVVMRAIAGFTIEIDSIDAKFKLSQNRSLEDQKRVVAGLRGRGDAESSRVAAEMEKILL